MWRSVLTQGPNSSTSREICELHLCSEEEWQAGARLREHECSVNLAFEGTVLIWLEVTVA
eukprot:676766-Rhodomonas_salina.1